MRRGCFAAKISDSLPPFTSQIRFRKNSLPYRKGKTKYSFLFMQLVLPPVWPLADN